MAPATRRKATSSDNPDRSIHASISTAAARPRGFADHAIRLAALWLLAGAVAKALTGLPSELPSPILAMDLDPVVVIVAAVFVETLVGIVALAAPRIAAPALAALLALFSLLLVGHLAQGGESCGCFGGALPVPAGVMLGVDLVFLGLVVALSLRERVCTPAALRAAFGRAATLGVVVGLAAALGLSFAADARLEKALSTGPTRDAGGQAAPAQASIVQPWSLPTTIPEQVLLRPSEWVGQPLAQTTLGTWTDTSVFPRKATLVFFYKSCSHCATILRDLAKKQKASPETAPDYVLVQLPTPPAYTGRLFVDEVPEHKLWVELPSVVKAYVMTPPWIVEVSDGIVRKANRIPWPIEQNKPIEDQTVPGAPAQPPGAGTAAKPG